MKPSKKSLDHYFTIAAELPLRVEPLLKKLNSIPEEQGELRYVKRKLSEVYNVIERHYHRVCVAPGKLNQ